MEVAYYPGCSLHAMALEYDKSARLVCCSLGVKLREVHDWNCCGATAAHSIDHKLATDLCTRNLNTVKDMGLKRVTAPCAACFNRLKTVAQECATKERSAEPEVEVSHLLQFLVQDVGLQAIIKKVIKPLSGLRIAAYYGCLLSRPARIAAFDDPEQPQTMDRLLQALGADTLNWSHKAECCGGSMALSFADIVLKLTSDLLRAASQAGAEAIVVACPLCQINLDTRQNEIEAKEGVSYRLPVLYFTQLMGLGYGISPRRLGLNRLLTDPFELLRAKGLV